MCRLSWCVPLLVVLLGPGVSSTSGVEPWADSRLPVREGLQLWLDASRVSGARPLRQKEPLAIWHDASGQGRHLHQSVVENLPTFLPVGETGLVRFDGLRTHLRALQQKLTLSDFTVFVVVAPRKNLGLFPAILAFNAPNERDYVSGMTLDFGPTATSRFSDLNVEGRGFGGARNLRTRENAFGQLHTLEIASSRKEKTIFLTVDGQREGERPREDVPLRAEEITVGARYYNNESGPQRVQGFGQTDIAEVLVYDRALTGDETRQVRAYLGRKHAHLRDHLPPAEETAGQVLMPMPNPPPVQVLLPGFGVRELPLGLTNINNVKYRADGALVALGYDGRVWLLRDTDGDGVEDRASLFWGNPGGLRSTIGMEVTPPGYPRGQGVFINGKSRCLLVVDTDGDDKADKEIEIAGGWKDTPHPVDGLGVALDPRDGSLFFGRGSANFTEPYLRDKDGKARYSTEQETGTIQRVSPDFKTREIVATGIRFPVAIRINAKGDLFCTDQEGATWSANGNPLDELLHVQKGRHYGFPARHPQHLPRVIDEPSTFDYGPQHQSTCGLNFNEPVHRNGPIFGPPTWRGNAIITGYSRGKLYRTQLEKTPAGYVARNHLLACLNMLTVDACVAPDGSLVVACHSGGPDWGSGPTGKGKLYKITHVDREQPQPALVWPNGPREVRVEFDRPVDPALLHDVVKNTKLTSGPFVRAGDRFESLWPGYAVVQAEKQTARRDVVVRSAQLTPDHRTLVLATDYNPRAEHRALQLPGMGRPALDASPRGGLPQHPAIDLDFDASGVEATWTPADGSPAWSGWLPHFDLELSRKWTVGSATHEALWRSMDTPGTLRLRARLHLNNMLNPVVQPGSRLDHEYPAEVVTVTFASPSELRLTSPEGKVLSEEIGTVALTLTPQPNKAYPVELHLTKKKPGPVPLAVHWSTSRDSRARPMPLHRILVPWAEVGAKPDALLVEARKAPELEGGSWARGRKVYFSEEAACGKCHSIHGQGGEVGPDLSNLIHRDYPSVLRDITQPSFAINPDHLGYVVTLQDGRTLTGVMRTMGDTLRIGDTKGVITEVKRSQVETMKPSSQSIMPEGLTKQLGPDRMRDLMTFLLTEPPHMPRDYAGARPPQRTLAEVRAALAGAPTPPEKVRPLKVLLVAGPKDHGPGEHDYPAWQKMWAELMASADKVEVKTAWEWPDKEAFARSDVIVFYQHGDWNGKRAADIDAYLERGGGLVYIHWAVDGRQGGPEFAKRIGLAGKGGVGFRHGAIQLDFEAKTQHPIRRNFDRLKMTDETYWNMVGNLPTERVLAWAVEEGKPRPQLWSLEQGRGRVFVSIPGHYSWTFDDPLFRLLLLRGIAWAAKEPVDRFNDLIWPGADIGR